MTISAKVIAHSVGEAGVPIATLQVRYPKFIHGEFMTHRVFSRNASSSRAIPVDRLIKDVIDDPVYPMHWGKNQPGMQADEECDARVKIKYNDFDSSVHPRNDAWDIARERAVSMARAFAAAGYHKQIVNRLIEPFCHINVVVTSTQWTNFFALRCHPGAQPEMRVLAGAMWDALATSAPRFLKHGEWHLPYVDEHEGLDETQAIQASVARCARVSYLTHEGKVPDVGDDLALYEKLVSSAPLHATPAEHSAQPDEKFPDEDRWVMPEYHGNLTGWIQYRKTLPGECQ